MHDCSFSFRMKASVCFLLLNVLFKEAFRYLLTAAALFYDPPINVDIDDEMHQ